MQKRIKNRNNEHDDVRLAKNRRFMRRVFVRLVKRLYPEGTKLMRLGVSEVGKSPFKHALRYELLLRTPAGILVRVFVRGNLPSSDTPYEIVVADRLQRALIRKGFAFGEFRVPVSFGVIPRLRLYLYEHYPGVTLEDLVRHHDPRSVSVARQAGMWIATLHRARLRTAPVRTISRIRDEVVFFRDDVAYGAPRHAGSMVRLLSPMLRAQHDIMAHYRSSFSTIHGDMNLGNAISGYDRSIAFIDFGASWVFDPLSDVGNFLAQIDFMAARRITTRSLAHKVALAFLRGYAQQLRGVGPDVKKRIDLHRAWWTLQILAFTASTNPAVGQRMTGWAFSTVKRLLTAWGYVPLGRLEDARPNEFHTALQNNDLMLGYFADHLASFFPGSQKIDALAINHPPALSTTSFLTRYELGIRLPNGDVQQRVVRGNSIDRSTFAILAAVYNNPHRTFDTIRPLRYERRLRYVFYEELDGTSLRSIGFRFATWSQLVARTARTLVDFHQTPFRGLRELSWREELRFLAALRGRIHRGGPPKIPDFRSGLRLLERAERRMWYEQKALVHNDFQPSNILTTPRGIGIIDYTTSGVGHPFLDVANFLIHLRVMLNGIFSEKKIEELSRAFARTYERGISQRQRERLRKVLPVFQLRSALDILATTLTNLSTRDRNRRRYVVLLRQLTAQLVTTITTP